MYQKIKQKILKTNNNASLTIKLMGSILLLSIVPLITFGIISYIETKDAITKEVNGNLANLAISTARGLDDWFTSLKVSIKAFASTVPDTTKHSELKDYLVKLQNSTGDTFETMFVTDTKGTTLAFSNQENNVDLSNRSYFRPALNGETLVSEIVISKQSGNPTVVIASPYKIDGEIKGVFGATVPIAKMTDIVNSIRIGETGYAYMIDRMGLVIAHPQKEKVLKENLIYTNITELREALTKSAAGESGMAEYSYEGITKYMAYAPIKTTNWSIGITAPLDDQKLFGQIKSMTNKLLFTILVALALVLGVSIVLIKLITRPINEIADIAQTVSKGDLTHLSKNESLDEIGQLSLAFNGMIKDLRQLVSEVQENASNLAVASSQISTTTSQISAGSQEQISQVTLMSTAIAQLTASIQQVTASAQEATKAGEETRQSAENGEVVVAQAIEGMNTVNDRITELGYSSKKIEEIIQVIDDIADQTNLLALNAAIEAARAGDQGKGFAVVAEEVRKLAERSRLATKEIEHIILNIKNSTNNAISAVRLGTTLTSDAGVAFKVILSKVQDTSNMIGEIAATCQQQTVSSNEVTEGIEEIVSVTEETTAVLEETASSAQELSAMANKLDQMTATFKI